MPDQEESYWCKTLPNMPRAFSPSSITTASTCARKFKFEYIDGYRMEPSPQIIFGTYFHKAVETFDYEITKGAEWIDATKAAVKHALHLAKDWNSEKTSHNRFTLIRAVVWYCDKYAKDPAKTVLFKDGALATEVPFKIALPLSNPDGDPYLLTGYIDGIARVADTLNYIRERKTTGGTISRSFYERYSMDNQPDAYIFAASVLAQEPFHAVLYDVVQTAVTFTEMGRHEEVRDQTQIEEWLEDTLYWIRTVEGWVAQNYFPANRGSCSNYGGCPFRPFCALPPSARQSFMDSNLQKQRREYIGRTQEELEM